MSTVPTAPATPRLSRTSLGLLIGAVVLIALAGIGLWMGSGAGGRTPAPSSPPPAVSPAARPSGVPYYTKDETEILREQARQEERNKIALERQYGK